MKQSIQIIFICLIIYPLFVFGNNVVVTSHPLATNVGEQILNDGGNAYDAAIAISATLSVVEPFASGLGGGGFWLAYDNSLKEYFFLFHQFHLSHLINYFHITHVKISKTMLNSIN